LHKSSSLESDHMLKNHITIAIRNILHDGFYSFLNIFGLTLGFTCFILITLFITDELSYEKHFTDNDRIYRVSEIIASEGGGENSASAPVPMGPTLLHDHSDLIETQTRFFNWQRPKFILKVGDQAYVEKKLFLVDSTVFDVFDFPFEKGDPKKALKEPNSIVLTQLAAKKYFGDEDPMGKFIESNNFWKHSMKVTGVLKKLKSTTHLEFDVLVNFSTIPRNENTSFMFGNFYWNPAWTYVKLKEGIEPERLEERFPDLVEKYFPENIQQTASLYLFPLNDIHLKSNLDFEMHPNSDSTYIYIFSIIAALVLFIACVNFINLSTARTAKRAREVGMRKILGAYKGQLIRQFIGETLFQAFIAFFLAVIASELLLKSFNSFSGKAFTHNFIFDPMLLLSFLGIWLLVGIVSGIYPAFYLSSFQPIKVLKSISGGSTKKFGLRSMLVVLQFAVSIILISGTVVAFKQLQYLQETRLGFDKEKVLIVPFNNGLEISRWDAMRKKLIDHNGISEITTSAYMLGDGHQTDNYTFEGTTEAQQIAFLGGGENFSTTFGIELLAGNDFSRSRRDTSFIPAIVNETLIKHVGWTSPEEAINKRISKRGGRNLQIVAVARDFNFASLHHIVTPVVIEGPRVYFYGMGGTYLAIRFDGKSYESTIKHTQATLTEFFPEVPFEYYFLDENLDALYRTERVMSKVITTFSVFAILVACLGLLGLTAFTAEQRTKEIGIRKVLGASEGNLVLLLSKEFMFLILISFIIAIPVSHYSLNTWLEDFAYRIDLSWLTYLMAGIITWIVALFTVGFQALRAATVNPVDSLSANS
jgi:putative ABC transport system permease protein